MTQTVADEFTEFYSANFRRIAEQLHAYLGDYAEAQDLTQEAFCRAFGRWDRIREYENAVGWVRQVAWNLATSRLRHLQVAMRHLSRQHPAHVEPPGPDRVDLVRALATLPPNHRLAVVLYHLAQLSTSEIAEQRGVAEGTVRSWLSRGRSQLAEYLLDADDWKAPEFKPQGAEAAAATARKHRTARRAILATVLVIAVVIPLALVLLKRDPELPTIDPTKAPVVPTPQASVEPRKLSMPGALSQPVPTVNFRDSQNAWSWHNTCLSVNPAPGCGPVMVRTNDGGLTWHQVRLPEIEPRSSVMVMATDHNTFTLEIGIHGRDVPTAYWLTRDGGATWIWYPILDPPAEALRTLPRYGMLCPNETNFLHQRVICDKLVLVDRHEKRVVATQPPLQGRQSYALNGADGRIWVINNDLQSSRVVYSSDGAKTWREQPLPPKVAPKDPGHIELSPDGSQVWFKGRSGLWKLVGQEWQRRLDRAMDDMGARLISNDLWLMYYNDGNYLDRLAYFKDGQFTIVAELKDVTMGVDLTEDGTVIAHSRDSTYYLGIGAGMNRHWVHLTM